MPAPLLAVPSAASAAAAAAHAAHIAAHATPRYAASGAVATILAKEAWRRLPTWVKEDPAFRSYNRAGSGAEDAGGESASGEEEMAHLTSSLGKLGAWLESGSEALGKSRLTRAQLHSAMLAFVHLSAQHDIRDGLYRQLNDDSHAPSQVELGYLRGVLDFATWAYVDYYGVDSVTEKLANQGFKLLSHAQSNVPGRVGHFVAFSKDNNTLLVGVKGTSTMEDLLTDAAGKAVSCSMRTANEGEDEKCGLEFCVEVDPNFIDVITDFDAIEVTRGEAIFVARDGSEVRCHEGVLLSSRRLCDTVQPIIQRYAVNGKCTVVICGHSLGGGCAALLAMLLRSRLPALAERDAIRAFAFGPPPAVDPDAAFSCAGYVTSVVNNSDVIPRCSVANLRVLLELLAVISDRLVDCGMGLEGPKRAAAFIKYLSGRSQGGNTLMSREEYGEAVSRAHGSIDVHDPGHLYVPGKVVLLYEPWMTSAHRSDARTKEKEDVGSAKSNTQIFQRNIRAAATFGTASPLRFLELGRGGMAFTDHLTTAYESSLDSLLKKNSGSSDV